MTNTAIPLLLHRGRPATVTGFIVPVIVDAVECQAFGSKAHISKEVLKGMAPSLTNRNSAPAVVCIPCVTWVQAALNHRSPNTVFRRFAASSRHPMSDATCAKRKARHSTAATFGDSASQAASSYPSLFPAITETLPEATPIRAPGVFECNQRTKSLISKVKLVGHLELILSGVKRTAVNAARPPYFTADREAVLCPV